MDCLGSCGAHLVKLDMGAFENGGEQAEQLGTGIRLGHGDVEQAVRVVGVGADQSAAVAAGIAEVGKCEVGDDLFGAVEHQPERHGRSRDSSASIAM